MLKILRLKNSPIAEQLKIEEKLLRHNNENWCIMNSGSPPAIVMGISNKETEWLHNRPYTIPLIRRFSGGGTVYVDEKTLFVTFIFQKEAHPFHPFPEPILRWAYEIYKPIMPNHFTLKENDFALDNQKCAGNAQYIRKERWLHHTSFLWDYSPETMEKMLPTPKKRPQYREERAHSTFLTTLKAYFDSPELFFERLEGSLRTAWNCSSSEST